ncbi:MAG: serine/threonine protein kinase, partial [Myxococcaceae bacterium]|nr:serine/threonine protein kinase [Myxococcaceae bacterium]
ADRWLIETRIGQGAMGSVFKGLDTRQSKAVAIKILAPEHCRKPKVLARFEREAKLMTTLRHPNIIQISGVGRRGALPYIVMQYLEGMTLYDVLKHKGGKLTAGETMAVVKQISAGLSFIHHHGLVHRDIKPQNVFVGPGGHVTILDLGVVRDKSNPGLTKPGAMVGTPYYMSPEQITGTEEIDKRTDVYALAAMTFELLVGKPPFQGTSNFEVLYAHRTQPAPDASLITKNVSKDAAKALMRGMGKTREERPQSATEFYADLEAFFGQSEKIDPKVAFAFLEKEAEKARQKEKDKAARKERERAAARGGAGPVPIAVKSTTRATTQSMKATGNSDPREELKARVTQPGGSPSSEIPMASSGDVEMLDANDATNAVLSPAHDTGHDGDDEEEGEVPAQHDTGIETEAISASGLESHRDSNRDTKDEDEPDDELEHPTGSNAAPPEHADPESTVMESGELRVVTTVKGLTTSCSLFIDDKPAGNTPCSLQLPEGRHQVRVERPTFKPVEKSVVVKANEVVLARLELQPPPAK